MAEMPLVDLTELTDKQKHDLMEAQRARDDAMAARRLKAIQDAREHISGLMPEPNSRGCWDGMPTLEARVREELRVARFLMGQEHQDDY